MLTFANATRATQGARSYQEDAAAVWPGTGPNVPAPLAEPLADAVLVAVLADGMGGHAGGAVASMIACGKFLEAFVGSEGAAVDRLRSGLEGANASVRRKIERSPSLVGMGATLVGVTFGDVGAHWISVGDSPLYLVRGGELARLNEDHSLAPLLDKMVAEGRLAAESARSDPRRHYLRSAVTGEEIDLVDISRKPLALEPDDLLILASDGIHTLGDDDIARLTRAYRGDGVEAIAAALIRAVEQAGDPYQDNTTVTLIGVQAS